MGDRAPDSHLVRALEQAVTAAVAVTARVLADVAPELTLLQWRVLVVIGNDDDRLPVGEVARRIGSKVPATSRLLRRLRERGYVDAQVDDGDARIRTVRLTAAGTDLRDRVLDRRRGLLEAGVAAASLQRDDVGALERAARALEADA